MFSRLSLVNRLVLKQTSFKKFLSDMGTEISATCEEEMLEGKHLPHLLTSLTFASIGRIHARESRAVGLTFLCLCSSGLEDEVAMKSSRDPVRFDSNSDGPGARWGSASGVECGRCGLMLVRSSYCSHCRCRAHTANSRHGMVCMQPHWAIGRGRLQT